MLRAVLECLRNKMAARIPVYLALLIQIPEENKVSVKVRPDYFNCFVIRESSILSGQ